jgi:acyl carrier protein
MTTTDQVIEIVAAQLQRSSAEFTTDTNLQEAGFESIDVIETVFALEERFGIDIPFNANEDAASFTTVRDVVSIVELQLAKKSAA